MRTLVTAGLIAVLGLVPALLLYGLIYGCLYLIRCVNIARRVTKRRRMIYENI
ncbi:MAG: hypothetical protein IJ347_07060 [Faecalibacterium sp.]|nr:hypothetical protein [Faecalibacterium sp.]